MQDFFCFNIKIIKPVIFYYYLNFYQSQIDLSLFIFFSVFFSTGNIHRSFFFFFSCLEIATKLRAYRCFSLKNDGYKFGGYDFEGDHRGNRRHRENDREGASGHVLVCRNVPRASRGSSRSHPY